jgi:hypothetical protein
LPCENDFPRTTTLSEPGSSNLQFPRMTNSDMDDVMFEANCMLDSSCGAEFFF